jgi:hypothetical protein
VLEPIAEAVTASPPAGGAAGEAPIVAQSAVSSMSPSDAFAAQVLQSNNQMMSMMQQQLQATQALTNTMVFALTGGRGMRCASSPGSSRSPQYGVANSLQPLQLAPGLFGSPTQPAGMFQQLQTSEQMLHPATHHAPQQQTVMAHQVSTMQTNAPHTTQLQLQSQPPQLQMQPQPQLQMQQPNVILNIGGGVPRTPTGNAQPPPRQ